MDLQSLLIVLIVIAIGGFSAYLADILGYKIGKKRLTIKRIRPKYVARISVVVAGMLIPIFTMLIIYSISSTFRIWITRGSQVVKDLEQNSRELEVQDKALKDATKLEAKLKNERQILDAELKDKGANLLEQTKKLGEQKKKLDDLGRAVIKARASVDKANRDRTAALASLVPIQQKLEAKQGELDAKQKEYEAADAKFKSADANYKETIERYRATSKRNLELTNDNANLTKTNEEIRKTSENLQTTIVSLNKDIELLKSQQTMAEGETKKAKGDLQFVLEELVRLRADAKVIEKNSEAFYRLKPLSFLRGEELTRFSIGANPSQIDATSAYRSLLRRAKSVASDRGAKADPDNAFSGTAGSLLTGTGQSYLTEDEVEKYWVAAIRNHRNESVLIAKAAVNLFGLEPVTLEIEILPNPIVFRKGEIVTESKIDGRSSEIEILNVIREFLRTYVNTKARGRKMIPVQGRDGESYGEFTQDQLLTTVARVKAVARLLRLVAVAKQDIRAGDPLDIDIEVR